MNRLALALLILIFTGAPIMPCPGQENETPQAYINETYSSVALDIYLDESGKEYLAA